MYQIVSDGSCDLSEELIKNNNLDIVPFYVSFDEQNYFKEGSEIRIDEVYEKMVKNENVFPKTSMPTVDDYYKCFEKYAKNNIDIICICITKKFSGSYNSASLAKKEIESKYNIKVEVIDAMLNTCIQGLLVLESARMQQAGLSFEENVAKVNEIKLTGRIFFTVGSMDYLRHGGRIGKLVGLIGATLKIKPLIVLKDGEIFPLGISFTRKLSMIKVAEHLKKHFEEIKEDYTKYRFIIGWGYDFNEVAILKSQILKRFPNAEIEVLKIGATIAVHTGPYPIGVGIIKKFDVN